MIQIDTEVRVRYGETDQMGYVYYGNYALYFEVGRVELLRALGTSYRAIEESGVMLPVLEYRITYRQPATYDDLLTIRTEIREMPRARITFHYTTLNEKGEVLNEGETTLVFVDEQSKRPVRMPEDLEAVFAPHFQ
ncbi:MAG: acyl-CoA thioesterase [Flavobacteriales bacterium]|nr:acyl-CoA thioesterase [Flavobacteriales bacterium]